MPYFPQPHPAWVATAPPATPPAPATGLLGCLQSCIGIPLVPPAAPQPQASMAAYYHPFHAAYPPAHQPYLPSYTPGFPQPPASDLLQLQHASHPPPVAVPVPGPPVPSLASVGGSPFERAARMALRSPRGGHAYLNHPPSPPKLKTGPAPPLYVDPTEATRHVQGERLGVDHDPPHRGRDGFAAAKDEDSDLDSFAAARERMENSFAAAEVILGECRPPGYLAPAPSVHSSGVLRSKPCFLTSSPELPVRIPLASSSHFRRCRGRPQ